MSDSDKEEKLLELIDELCSKLDQSSSGSLVSRLDGWLQKLNEIYSGGYKHNYVELSRKLEEIFRRDLQEETEVENILGENLNSLKTYMESKEKENVND